MCDCVCESVSSNVDLKNSKVDFYRSEPVSFFRCLESFVLEFCDKLVRAGTDRGKSFLLGMLMDSLLVRASCQEVGKFCRSVHLVTRYAVPRTPSRYNVRSRYTVFLKIEMLLSGFIHAVYCLHLERLIFRLCRI